MPVTEMLPLNVENGHSKLFYCFEHTLVSFTWYVRVQATGNRAQYGFTFTTERPESEDLKAIACIARSLIAIRVPVLLLITVAGSQSESRVDCALV